MRNMHFMGSLDEHISNSFYDVDKSAAWSQVRQTIEKELGKPMNDIFSHFVEEPLATASVRSL